MTQTNAQKIAEILETLDGQEIRSLHFKAELIAEIERLLGKYCFGIVKVTKINDKKEEEEQ